MKPYNVMFIAILSLSSSAFAHKLIADSGEARVQLVELYTSEGCSSCPPADKWFSTLKERNDLWKSFVPVAFHVDYWNDLGWKDGFSSDLMTQRQRDVAATWGTPSVYTPAVVVDGQEWQAWSKHVLPAPATSANLKLSVFQEANGDFEVHVDGRPRGTSAEIYNVRIARLGMGLSSKVLSGENSGQLLAHDFVVLNWDVKKLGTKENQLTFHLGNSEKKPTRTALAVWVEKLGRPAPLQATGSYL